MADYSFDQNLLGGVSVAVEGTAGRPIELSGGTKVSIEGVAGKPVESKVDLALPDPIKSDVTLRSESKVQLESESAIKLETDNRVAADSCVRLTFGPPPESRLTTPYHHKMGFKLFGVEFASIEWCGEAEARLEPLRPAPRVAFGSVSSRGVEAGKGEAGQDRPSRGVRIRLGD